MAHKLTLLCLAVAVALSSGADLERRRRSAEQDDVLFNMVQAFISEPEAFAPSLGMSRVKRSADGRAFNFNAEGVAVNLEYKDPANKLKGGKLKVVIDNLKAKVPMARSGKVVLNLEFDGGSSTTDGLFTIKGDYELNHAIKETGTLDIVRAKSGAEYKTTATLKSNAKGKPQQIIPGFVMDLKSNHATYLKGEYKCDDGRVYAINVDRKPLEQLIATVTGPGVNYRLQGDLSLAAKTLDVVLQKNNVELAKLKANAAVTQNTTTLTANVEAVNKAVDVTFTLGNDLKSIILNVKFNGADILALKGKRDVLFDDKLKKMVKTGKIKYKSIGFGEASVMYLIADGYYKFGYSPKDGKDLKILLTREQKTATVSEWHGKATRDNEVYLKYDNKIDRKAVGADYVIDAESTFHVSTQSVFHAVFCRYGCFNDRTMKAKVRFNQATPGKMVVDVALTKDGAKVLELDVQTMNNPYKFKVFAPRILPKILPTGRDSIEFDVDHNKGQYLRITSNTNLMSQFSVERTGGANNERKVMLNGKELSRGSAGNRQFSNIINLPNGEKVTVNVNWVSDDTTKNKVVVKATGVSRNLDATLDWDLRNAAAYKIDLDAKGNNPRWGAYSLTRNIKFGAANNVMTCSITGSSNFPNAPWPNPVTTDLNASLNFNSNDFNISVKKVAKGKAVTLSYNNGRINVDF